MRGRQTGKLEAVGRALYQKGPTAAELNIWGMSYADWEQEEEENRLIVWPENELAVKLFRKILNQWIMGMDGPIALNYLVLYHHMDRMELSPEDHDSLHNDIQVLEAAALKEIHSGK